MLYRTLDYYIFTTKNDTIIPVAKAAKVLSINYNGAGVVPSPFAFAIYFLKFSKRPNLADPNIPTPIKGVRVPILNIKIPLYKASGP